jgi:hypothetical protein
MICFSTSFFYKGFVFFIFYLFWLNIRKIIVNYRNIIASPDIRTALTSVVLSANDPVAAWGGVKLLREKFGIEPAVVTGPATDNAVGVNIIRDQFGVPAFNAITDGAALADRVIESAGLNAKVAAVEPTE